MTHAQRPRVLFARQRNDGAIEMHSKLWRATSGANAQRVLGSELAQYLGIDPQPGEVHKVVITTKRKDTPYRKE